MATSFIQEVYILIDNGAIFIKPWLEVIAILWCFNLMNWLTGSYLNQLGIYPRRARGLIGIPFMPILHRDFTHLLFNSIPLFFLGMAILMTQGVIQFIWITAVIIMIGGLGVWLFARKGIHIGASSLISGYFGYILISAYTQPGVITVILAMTAFYYFGGIIFGIFPGKKDMSWEGHFFGLMAGIACAYLPNFLGYYIQQVYPYLSLSVA